MKRLSLGVLAAALLALASCSGGRPAPTGALASRDVAVPVTVAAVAQRIEPVEIGAIGSVLPYSTVQVKAEVGGELTGVHFTEGQEVHKGDLLFTLDARPFDAALKQAIANRARDQAQATNAQADAERYVGLAKDGVIAVQQYDQARFNAEALKAAVGADDAAIENARVQLSYTKIYSALDGRTGNLLVHRGNLIKPNDVPLVVINQIQPIFVAFSVPAPRLPEIKRYLAAHPLRVEAGPKGSGSRAASGALTFIDNSIDLSTGTIQLKGTFENRDRSLWPGEFVDTTLTLSTEPHAIVVPSQAIQAGQQGQFVFVVKSDLTVEARPVTVSRTLGPDAIIGDGLHPGETVVTDGQLRLAPGVRVRVAKGGAS